MDFSCAEQTTQFLYDAIVVGAGVAGASLAISLARDGRSVLCIERQLYDKGSKCLMEPSRIVGELLQPGGYEKLKQLGLADAVEGIDAVPIYGYAIFLDERAQAISYSAHTDVSNAKGPSGRSFHNGRFLRRLREIATAVPNLTLLQGSVTALDMDANSRVVGVSFRSTPTGEIRHARAHLTVACDGCSSSLRRHASVPNTVEVYSNFHGLILDMADIPFPNYGHVVLADSAPVLLYPISSNQVRCLVDISSDFHGDVLNYMLTVVATRIPSQFEKPFEAAVKSGRSRMMPNRVMPAPADVLPGAILLGDAFNMRHPLTGGGMTVALSDTLIIRDLLRTVPSFQDTGAVADCMTTFYQLRKPLSSTINILANALYAVFCAQDSALRDMRDACYDYITSGGRMTYDPMGMLGGIKPYRYLLLAHFFAVAFLGCGRALVPFPSPSRIHHAWSIFKGSYNIIKPLIDAEKLTPLHWIPLSTL